MSLAAGIRINLFFWSCCLFLFTLLFPIKVNNIAIGAMILGAIINPENSSFKNQSDLVKRFLPMILFYVLYLFTFFYSSDFTGWKHHAEVKSTFLILPVLFWWQSHQISTDRINRLLTAFILGVMSVTLYLLAIAFIKYLQTGASGYFFYHELTEPLRLHAIYLANYLALVVLLALHKRDLFEFKNGIVIRILLVIFSMVIIFLLSALSVIGFLMIWLILFLITGISKRNWVNIFGGAIIFLMCAMLIFKLPYTRMKIEKMYSMDYKMDDPDYAWNSLTIRMAMWTCGYQVVRDNLLFGVGAGDEQSALMNSYGRNNFKEGIRCEYNSHNQYLSTLISSGLVGAIFLLVMLLSPIYHSVRNDESMLVVGFTLLIALGLATENMFTLQKGTILFASFYVVLQMANQKLA